MTINARYDHTNLIARDLRRIAAFYQNVFGCELVGTENDISGEWLEQGVGVPRAHIHNLNLRLPGLSAAGPTLEIFHYDEIVDAPPPPANRVGFGHICFEVEDVAAARDAVLAAGGSTIGEIGSVLQDRGNLIWVYVRDPEGNIIEIHHVEPVAAKA